MTFKYIALALGATLFTAINLAVLAANWSITARAEVAGMDYRDLIRDRDFRRAVESIVEDCKVDHEDISC
jgi:hypothetical protein